MYMNLKENITCKLRQYHTYPEWVISYVDEHTGSGQHSPIAEPRVCLVEQSHLHHWHCTVFQNTCLVFIIVSELRMFLKQKNVLEITHKYHENYSIDTLTF